MVKFFSENNIKNNGILYNILIKPSNPTRFQFLAEYIMFYSLFFASKQN